jgi:hypothetical protein
MTASSVKRSSLGCVRTSRRARFGGKRHDRKPEGAGRNTHALPSSQRPLVCPLPGGETGVGQRLSDLLLPFEIAIRYGRNAPGAAVECSAEHPGDSIGTCQNSHAFMPSGPNNYSGIVTRPLSTLMRSSGRGASGMGGTLAVSSGGAWPASPPRGVVRTTWLSGSGACLVR